ncbi:hypothetical protein MKW94_014560 [Papaver nudicaule]|uniref:F-box associated beta-propeller type 1 domain-containing protein n=1 Tax=Papaver nudicaule TaxID=74823 RepID=A0AA41UY89_PAPNU|nr:hypothetical protein [Papaver nudicaule]
MEEGNKGDLLLVNDLLIQILVWLVLSLLRFKTVCKSWRSIIESSDFIHLHATFNNDDTPTKNPNKTGTLIFQYTRLDVKNMGRHRVPHFFVLSSSSGSPSINDSNGDDYPNWLYKDLAVCPRGDQLLERHRPVTMVASCHGIICLHHILSRDIFLWNPATKQFRILPKSLPLEEEFGEFQDDYVGFGFDTETKDYKVLLITSFKSDYWEGSEPKAKNRVQVYSMHTDSWRRCLDVHLPTYCFSRKDLNQGVYLNGRYLFLALQFYKYYDEGEEESFIGNDKVVVSFDFSKETYRIIPAPSDNVRLDIRGRDGKIVCVTCLLPNDRKCQVYVLNDDTLKNEYSWTKLYETDMSRPDHSSVGPMVITKDGLSGFLPGSDGYGLMLYKFECEEMKDIQIANVSFKDVMVDRAQILIYNN